jgi:hypothetical protein
MFSIIIVIWKQKSESLSSTYMPGGGGGGWVVAVLGTTAFKNLLVHTSYMPQFHYEQ